MRKLLIIGSLISSLLFFSFNANAQCINYNYPNGRVITYCNGYGPYYPRWHHRHGWWNWPYGPHIVYHHRVKRCWTNWRGVTHCRWWSR